NLTNVTIWGVEARGEYRFAPQWSVLGWTAFAQGTATRTGLPVDSVSPWATQARVRYGSDEGLVAQLIGTMTAQHTQVSNPTYFQTPAYFNLRSGEPVGDAGTRALRLGRGPRGAAHRHDDGAAHPGQQSDLLPDTGLLQS